MTKSDISNGVKNIRLSVIIPLYNEAENISELYGKLKHSLSKLNENYEIIFIDDGSGDESADILKKIAENDSKIKVIRFAKNFGQTAAISAGFKNSQGEIIIPMDADLQNDPEDIPKFLAKIEEGYDVVAGWRKNRKDKFLTKTLPSKIANKIISRITKVRLHDYGCTMKACKKNVMENIALYGEMHRFIPAYTSWVGAKVAEIETTHHPRKFGKTKYNLGKTLNVILDTVTVKFLGSYLNKPMHFFGGIGFIALFSAFITAGAAVYLRIFSGMHLTRSPLLLFSTFLGIIGVLFILMGLLAEIIVRVYFESQKRENYLIKEKINFDEPR